MDPAIQSMIDNLPEHTGKSLSEWYAVLDSAGLEKHGEMLLYLKTEHGVTHGYANGIVLQYRSRGAANSDDDLVDAQYAGAKAGLRPIYEQLVASVRRFGNDVQISPKKTSVSLRRSKQFALIEPASAQRVQLGINLPGFAPTDRLKVATGMCTHKLSLTALQNIDDEVQAWLRQAYDLA